MREQTGRAAHEDGRACARAEDLVAFLYGEADPAAARDFRTHLQACAVCREEAAGFGDVRARVAEWRVEGLGDAPALGLSGAFAPASVATARARRVRSARAALREFFSLAPLWLRAGAVAAVLAVCVMTALSLARAKLSWGDDGLAFEAGVPERVVTKVEKVEARPPDSFDAEQIEALVQQRVREALTARRGEEQTVAEGTPFVKHAPRVEEVVNPPRRKRAAPRATPRGRRQLEEDESLPRLSDLLSGVY